MSARRIIGGVLVGSPFAGIVGFAVWATWGPTGWTILGSLGVGGMIFLGVHLLMTEPRQAKPVLLDVSRDPQQHPRDDDGRYIDTTGEDR